MRVYPVILAGGKGTRIGAKSRPKVLFELAHKPILDWTIRSVKKAVKQTPIIVIGYKGEQIKKYFGSQFLYVWQKKLLGTAHAFLQAKKVLKNKKGWCLVVNGDNPLFLPQTFKKMIKKGESIPFDIASIRTVQIDINDLDSVEEGKNEIIKQIRYIEGGKKELNTPISTALGIQ